MNQNDSQKARQDQKYQIRFLTYSFFKKKENVTRASLT